jgi:Tfp pilus assembly protein PilV
MIEILIGIALGTVLILSAGSLIAPSLRTNTKVNQVQTQTQLAKELADNVREWAAGNWNNIFSLATGTASGYYLNATTSPFTAVATSGFNVESVVAATTTYRRYFYLSDLYRTSGGNVTTTITGNNYDPSSKLVTIVVSASSSNALGTTTVNIYLTRNLSNAISQSSWAGSSGQTNPVTLIGTTYATSSNVVINAGAIQLAPSAGSCVM